MREVVILGVRAMEKGLVKAGKFSGIKSVVVGLAFNHTPELLRPVFEQIRELGLKNRLGFNTCLFICLIGVFGGLGGSAECLSR